MIYNLSNPYDAEKFMRRVKTLTEQEKLVELSVEKEETEENENGDRTSSQNKYLHLIISYFASQYGCSVDEAKIDFYKRTCNKELFERWRKNKRGDLVAYLRSSANLSKEEMSLSIDRFRYWSASVAGIYLPQKEDKEAMRYIRQEIDRNRVYL